MCIYMLLHEWSVSNYTEHALYNYKAHSLWVFVIRWIEQVQKINLFVNQTTLARLCVQTARKHNRHI